MTALPPPPPPPPTAAPGSDRTTLWGVLGIVGAFCCWPLGVLFAVLCLLEARKHGKQPTLAYVAFAILAVVLVIHVCLFGTGNYPGVQT